MMIFEMGFVIFSCVVWVQFEVEGSVVFGELPVIGLIGEDATWSGGGKVIEGSRKNTWRLNEALWWRREVIKLR